LVERARAERQETRASIALLDTSILEAIIVILHQRFTSVLIPSDPRLFHRCFLRTVEFIRDYQSRSHSRPDKSLWPLLRSLLDQFSISVYFKLETSPLHAKLCDLETTDMFIPADTFSILDCLIPYSNACLFAIRRIFSDEVFIGMD
jgi:hypothetical protein